MARDRLIAWIEQRAPCEFVAAFVASATASERRPAVCRCSSQHEARHWVEAEAAEFEVPVDWVDRPPQLVR
jgi:hypothetical protein